MENHCKSMENPGKSMGNHGKSWQFYEKPPFWHTVVIVAHFSGILEFTEKTMGFQKFAGALISIGVGEIGLVRKTIISHCFFRILSFAAAKPTPGPPRWSSKWAPNSTLKENYRWFWGTPGAALLHFCTLALLHFCTSAFLYSYIFVFLQTSYITLSRYRNIAEWPTGSGSAAY